MEREDDEMDERIELVGRIDPRAPENVGQYTIGQLTGIARFDPATASEICAYRTDRDYELRGN
ncbi:hypothetical protein HY212_00675 [Candidatus Pacearchaeota archaeon]|nr:hypothetical protein [Candidatus Pacearchaeota archaeon]